MFGATDAVSSKMRAIAQTRITLKNYALLLTRMKGMKERGEKMKEMGRGKEERRGKKL